MKYEKEVKRINEILLGFSLDERKKCNKCFKLFPLNELFSYVDGNNISISKYSKEYCETCYNEVYLNLTY